MALEDTTISYWKKLPLVTFCGDHNLTPTETFCMKMLYKNSYEKTVINYDLVYSYKKFLLYRQAKRTDAELYAQAF